MGTFGKLQTVLRVFAVKIGLFHAMEIVKDAANSMKPYVIVIFEEPCPHRREAGGPSSSRRNPAIPPQTFRITAGTKSGGSS
jgi:hypothetical protein